MSGKSRIGMFGVIALFGVVMMASSMASASPISDVADALNDGLFGGANLFAAQAILTAAVMMSAGLVLGMLGLDNIPNIIVLVSILAALTAIGWADPTMLLLTGMLIAGLGIKKGVEYMTGSGTAGTNAK